MSNIVALRGAYVPPPADSGDNRREFALESDPCKLPALRTYTRFELERCAVVAFFCGAITTAAIIWAWP